MVNVTISYETQHNFYRILRDNMTIYYGRLYTSLNKWFVHNPRGIFQFTKKEDAHLFALEDMAEWAEKEIGVVI